MYFFKEAKEVLNDEKEARVRKFGYLFEHVLC